MCAKPFGQDVNKFNSNCNGHILKDFNITLSNLELRHPRCVCNIKVQCKEVKNTTSLYL